MKGAADKHPDDGACAQSTEGQDLAEPNLTGRERRECRMTPQRIREVTNLVAGRLGLDAYRARLVSFSHNAVVRLPPAAGDAPRPEAFEEIGPPRAAVLRIPGSRFVMSQIPVMLTAHRWLSENGIRVPELWPGLEQPLELGQCRATVWREGPADRDSVLDEELSRVLLRIHRIEATPPPELPDWEPLTRIRARIAQADGVDPWTLELLTNLCDELESLVADLARCTPLLPPGIIHGDLHPGNLIRTDEGPVVCDLDEVVIGPREWDLAVAAVHSLRFTGDTSGLTTLERVHGVDVTRWEGFEALRRIRELQLVTSVLPVLRSNPVLRPQWEIRLDSLRRNDSDARWRPFFQVPAGPRLRKGTVSG
jgi:hypothetical protein